jgi:hypothetical protein
LGITGNCARVTLRQAIIQMADLLKITPAQLRAWANEPRKRPA